MLNKLECGSFTLNMTIILLFVATCDCCLCCFVWFLFVIVQDVFLIFLGRDNIIVMHYSTIYILVIFAFVSDLRKMDCLPTSSFFCKFTLTGYSYIFNFDVIVLTCTINRGLVKALQRKNVYLSNGIRI